MSVTHPTTGTHDISTCRPFSADANGFASTRGSLLFLVHRSILLKQDGCSPVVQISQQKCLLQVCGNDIRCHCKKKGMWRCSVVHQLSKPSVSVYRRLAGPQGQYEQWISCPHQDLTHCGRVTQICIFNMVKLGTSVSSPYCHSTRGNVSRGIIPSSTTRVFGEYFLKISVHKNS